MSIFSIRKSNLKKFLMESMESYELIAPVKTDLVRFQKIEKPEQVCLSENSFFPVKEYLFSKKERIFSFDGKKINSPKEKHRKRVFFGLRRCDLNAISNQDHAFLDSFADPYYKARRKNTILAGYHCNKAPNIYCFCGSMDLKDCYDLMFFDKGDCFIVDAASKKGERFVKSFKRLFLHFNCEITEEMKKIENTDRLLKKDISKLYEHQDWQKGVDLCLSCGACTILCPTCYCFEICDKINIRNLKKSERLREWSSCQLKSFTRIAGNFSFREPRADRFKHRIYHQLEYFKEKKGINLCVGCGRCIAACPTRIDFIKIINEMK